MYILGTGFMWTVQMYTQTQNWFHLVRTFLLIFERLKVNFNLETHGHTHRQSHLWTSRAASSQLKITSVKRLELGLGFF